MKKPPLTCCRCGEKRQLGNPMYYCPAPICDIKGLPVCHGCFKDLGVRKGILDVHYSGKKCPLCRAGKLRIIPLIGSG